MMNSEPLGHQRHCCRCFPNNTQANRPDQPKPDLGECRGKACSAGIDMSHDSDAIITRKSDWEVLCGPISFPGQAKKRGV